MKYFDTVPSFNLTTLTVKPGTTPHAVVLLKDLSCLSVIVLDKRIFLSTCYETNKGGLFLIRMYQQNQKIFL